MPGFARDEQRVLACLVRCHRRKPGPEPLDALPGEWRRRALRLTVLLRLAVLLNRGRTSRAAAMPVLRSCDATLSLALPARWLRANPLTEADLVQECRHLAALGLAMRVVRTQG